MASATSTAGGSAGDAGACVDAAGGEMGVPRKGTKLRAFGAGRADETAGSEGDAAIDKVASGTLAFATAIAGGGLAAAAGGGTAGTGTRTSAGGGGGTTAPASR